MSTPAAIRYTVPPKQASLITMKTVPDAECTLSTGNQDASEAKFLLYADQDGVVRFHVTPGAESDGIANFVLECNENGNIVQYPLELRPSNEPTEDHPAPTKPLESTPEGAYVRPGLSAVEARNLTLEELSKGGYPARPDPDKSPDAFLHWAKLVSKPATFVPPHTVSRRDISSKRPVVKLSVATTERGIVGTEPSPNWSGFKLTSTPGTYSWVDGNWIVPSVSSYGLVGVQTYSALWVGLDGDYNDDGDLVQAGTVQGSIVILVTISAPGIKSPVPFEFASYYMWTEFLPQQTALQQVNSVPVSPGDEVYAIVTVGDGILAPNLNGPNAYFMLENATIGKYTIVTAARGNTEVLGSQAEWIMERPTAGFSDGTPNYTSLSEYGTATLSGAYAGNATVGTAYGNGPEIQITMVNGNDLLSTVTSLNETQMQFNWHGYS